MIVWLVLCAFIAFEMYIDINRDDLEAVGGRIFIGFMFTFLVFNIRSLYLSIPETFRKKSAFLQMLRKKMVIYYFLYLVIVIIASFVATHSSWKIIIYLPTLGVSLLLIMVIGAADLGRYRMSAFASVLHLLKTRKQGGE